MANSARKKSGSVPFPLGNMNNYQYLKIFCTFYKDCFSPICICYIHLTPSWVNCVSSINKINLSNSQFVFNQLQNSKQRDRSCGCRFCTYCLRIKFGRKNVLLPQIVKTQTTDTDVMYWHFDCAQQEVIMFSLCVFSCWDQWSYCSSNTGKAAYFP